MKGEKRGDNLAIERLQNNLGTIRKVANMTASELALEIGVSRQTISSLENKRSKMNKTQYLALRSVFNYRAANDPALARVIMTLVDDCVEDANADYGKLDEQSTISAFKATTMAGASLTTALLAGALPFPAGMLAAIPTSVLAAFPLLSQRLEDEKRENPKD